MVEEGNAGRKRREKEKENEKRLGKSARETKRSRKSQERKKPVWSVIRQGLEIVI